MTRRELVEDLTNKIIEIKKKNLSNCIIIGIEGQGCSGKSYLSKELKESLTNYNYNTQSISIDDFCNEKKIRYSGDLESYEQLYYNNFNYQRFETEILKFTKEQGFVSFDDYVLDIQKDEFTRKISIISKDILIVEGVFIFKNEFKKYYDLSIFITVKEDERIRRALKRDLEKNLNKENVLEKYYKRYLPGYKLYEELNFPKDFSKIIIENTNSNTPVYLKNII